MSGATQELVEQEVVEKKEEKTNIAYHCPFCGMMLPSVVFHNVPKKSFWKRHISPNTVHFILTILTIIWSSICFGILALYFKNLMIFNP